MSVYPANQVNSIFKEHLEDERQYKTTSLSSKIASFVKNIFNQIGEAISSAYRFVANLISKNDPIHTEVNKILKDAFSVEFEGSFKTTEYP